MLSIMGKAASGKDTVKNILTKQGIWAKYKNTKKEGK